MRILQLKAENIKKLKAVEIRPDGTIVQITGKNAAGKTSVLDSILYALAGERSLPSAPLRKGAEKGEIRLDLGELIVVRSFTEVGSYLKVSNKDGANFSSPQKMLDKIYGDLSFDPLEFMRLKPGDQRSRLLELTGSAAELLKLEEQRAKFFDRRSEINREVRRLEGVMNTMKLGGQEIPAARPEPIDTSALMTERGNRQKTLSDRETKEERDIEVAKSISAHEEAIEKLKAEITVREGYIVTLRTEQTAIRKEMEDWEPITLEDIDGKIASASKVSDSIAAFDRWDTTSKELQGQRSKSEELTNEIDQCDKQKTDLLKKSTLPVDGLGFSDAGVTLADIPLEQASAAEQLKVSLGIAMAANPKLRVIRITDGSLLDKHNLEVIRQMATDKDYQVWIEQVEESGNVGIYIEDGEVVHAKN